MSLSLHCRKFSGRLCVAILLLAALPPPSVVAAGTSTIQIRNVLVSHDRFPAHSEPAIAENPLNHQNLIAGSKLFTDPVHYRFKIGTFYSMDGGRTWHDNGLLPGFQAYGTTSDISIAFSAKGEAYVCVLALNGTTSGIFVSRSADGGKTFGDPVQVFLDTTGATFSDKPWITIDDSASSHSSHAGTIYVAWNLDSSRDSDSGGADLVLPAQDQPGSTAPPPVGLVVSRSVDGGQTFGPPQRIDSFDQNFEIGAIPAVGPDGTLYVVYAVLPNNQTVTYLDLVTSSDGGLNFSTPHIIQDVRAVPNHLGSDTFRNLSLPTFAVSPKDGTLAVAWADEGNSDTDILASRSTDKGITWSTPARVNHDRLNNGKDHFQPALAVSANGTFTCAWFDRRYDPKNHLIDEVIAQSSDGGLTFGHNFRVTKKSWDPSIDAPRVNKNDTFIGDYQALAADDRTVFPLWNDTQGGHRQQIRTAVISVQLFVQYARRHGR